ncbi:AraC family transcriptional regulator [Sinomicrobium soli]|uniref:AraC family transcriptional regulator n=1 Tax=Sinomicrobium sp. N-1-3-6 TaxID=2219864 RepID=UPI000DCAEDE8|nr:AraC family transcriptional regulator [Sinomicrobium sp. N-1-3-6]RAV28335.1 AraC family transcriptional regulator [Sinomicrobium sp. N-1-3-6]
MITEDKNIAVSAADEVQLEEGFSLLRIQNEGSAGQHLTREIDCSYIQFHFGLRGDSRFNFSGGRYHLQVGEEQSLLLYNPQRDLPIDVEIGPKAQLLSVLISIQKFHSLFSHEAGYIHFLSEENKDRKYYDNADVSPAMMVVLNQMVHYNLRDSVKRLYLKGKAYELLGLYFNKPDDADTDQCPFLVDEENVARIKRAKDIVIANMAEPPTLENLANEVGLNLKKLKTGFKQIYGDSVYSFLFDYKMEYARKMLEGGAHNVNEVGFRIGYSTASHFIAAFKKKYGTTPKKYLMSLNV